MESGVLPADSSPRLEDNRPVDERHARPQDDFSVAPDFSPGLVQQALAVLGKDLRAELRNRAALNAILLFSITTLVIVAFALGPGQLPPVFKAALLWVV